MAAQRTLDLSSVDLSSVRLLRVPDAAPPLDCDTLPAYGALRPELPSWVPAADRCAASRPPVPPAGQPRGDTDWTRQFARLLTETMAGMRPMRQIMPWMTDRARVHFRKGAPVLRGGQRPRVLRVLASWPKDTVAELSIIVGLGPRTLALAVRLEKTERPGQPARWLCTDIETA